MPVRVEDVNNLNVGGGRDAPGEPLKRNILVNCHSFHTALFSRWAPRYTRKGYALVPSEDLDTGALAALREAGARALELENYIGEFVYVEKSYECTVAIDERWLLAPPDPNEPLGPQTTTFILNGCGAAMRAMHQTLVPVVSAYVGMDVMPTVSYGPRLYRPGSILLGHTDERYTHAIGVSITLQGEPWEMQTYDLSIAETGESRFNTSEAQHVIYEGNRMIHARMDPLRGGDYVAAFFHFHDVDGSVGPQETRGQSGGQYPAA